MGKLPGLEKKWKRCTFPEVGYRMVSLYSTEMVCRGDTRTERSAVWCSHGRLCPEGSGKEDHSALSKAFYLGCKKPYRLTYSKD